MAFTAEIQVGQPTAVVQNTIYALPPCIVHLTSTTTVEIGNDVSSTTTWVVLTGSNTVGAFTSAAFARESELKEANESLAYQLSRYQYTPTGPGDISISEEYQRVADQAKADY